MRRKPLNTLTNRYRAQLVQSVEGLCRQQAHYYYAAHPHAGELEDYQQAARYGAWQAALRFQPRLGWRFTTYATYWIRQGIQHLVVWPQLGRLRQTRDDQSLRCAGVVQLDEQHHQAVLTTDDPEVGARAEVDDLLRLLDERSRQVLQWRFGLGGKRPQSLAEIAARLSLSRERIRQIEERAVERLRGKA